MIRKYNLRREKTPPHLQEARPKIGGDINMEYELHIKSCKKAIPHMIELLMHPDENDVELIFNLIKKLENQLVKHNYKNGDSYIPMILSSEEISLIKNSNLLDWRKV